MRPGAAQEMLRRLDGGYLAGAKAGRQFGNAEIVQRFAG
jgi:hypothetical protein